MPYQHALQELDWFEQNLKAELQNAEASTDSSRSGESNKMLNESNSAVEAHATEASKYVLMEKLENKKKELVWCMVNLNALCLYLIYLTLIGSGVPYQKI